MASRNDLAGIMVALINDDGPESIREFIPVLPTGQGLDNCNRY